MILARLTRAVREQNWFAVALEFVIVVAGVLLAFQISAWSAQRADRTYAMDILDRFHAELVTIETVRSRGRSGLQTVIRDLDSARPVILGVSDRTALTAEECNSLGRSHDVTPPADQLPTLDELMQSGSLRVVRSSTLRRSASSAYAMIAAGDEFWASLSPRLDNLSETIPAAIRPVLARRESESDSASATWTTTFRCDLAVMQARSDFQSAFLDNREVLMAINGFNNASIDAILRQLHAAVDDELELDHAPIGNEEALQ